MGDNAHSSQSCHKAMLVDELLIRIFGYLELPQSKHNLASAARTCKAWSEVALDMIWKDLEGFDMLRVVRSWGVQKDGWTEENLTSFRSVNYRVRSIIILSTLVAEAFRNSNVTPLFPALEELTWNEVSISVMTPFINNSLTKLHIFTPGQCLAEDFFHQLSARCRNIAHLTLCVSLTQQGFNALLSTLALQQDLQHILPYLFSSGGVLTRDVDGQQLLASLETHPKLKEINIGSELKALEMWSPSSPAPFPALRILKFDWVKSSTACFLTTLHNTSSLTSLTLNNLYARDVEGSVSAAALHSTLEYLSIECHFGENPPMYNPPHHDVLNCLSACRNLRTLLLDLHYPEIPISDQDFRVIISQMIHLRDCRIFASSAQLTVAALAHLAACCPELERVEMEFDAVKGWDTVAATPHHALRNLREVYVKGSQISEHSVRNLVRFFRGLSERPEMLELSYLRSSGDRQSLWKEVERGLEQDWKR